MNVLERLFRRRRKPCAPTSDPREKERVRNRHDELEHRLSVLEAAARVMRREQ